MMTNTPTRRRYVLDIGKEICLQYLEEQDPHLHEMLTRPFVRADDRPTKKKLPRVGKTQGNKRKGKSDAKKRTGNNTAISNSKDKTREQSEG